MKFKLVENIIFNQEDEYINFDKFESGKTNILIITGFSGSGKSTLAKQLAEKYDAYNIELDNLMLYLNKMPEFKLEIDPILTEFIKEYNLEQNIAINKTKKDEIFNLYINWLKNYAKKHPTDKFIINGLEIYENVDPKLIKGIPIIIKGTSALSSTFRATKRNTNYFTDKNKIKEFNDLLSYALNDDKHLNKVKKEIKKLEI